MPNLRAAHDSRSGPLSSRRDVAGHAPDLGEVCIRADGGHQEVRVGDLVEAGELGGRIVQAQGEGAPVTGARKHVRAAHAKVVAAVGRGARAHP
eukprot:scaffold2010_cov301-Prasinococcus_capsulatus_cf.AAC.6